VARRLPRRAKALCEGGLMFLPALPAYLWPWPAVGGTALWFPFRTSSIPTPRRHDIHRPVPVERGAVRVDPAWARPQSDRGCGSPCGAHPGDPVDGPAQGQKGFRPAPGSGATFSSTSWPWPRAIAGHSPSRDNPIGCHWVSAGSHRPTRRVRGGEPSVEQAPDQDAQRFDGSLLAGRPECRVEADEIAETLARREDVAGGEGDPRT